ncbi:hypothetical protein GCM10017764_33390 [Sphingobacterium griseoflavum]|uniref:Uncharacterized protein n=1 Tax=Sphingobacterium griseoflavum TaxID=1474952 RepID=A0ABQ3I150_9SPHI|nr:hypothetical protein GCM10017764_33390 [Sphingobacterium griseoflavum]
MRANSLLSLFGTKLAYKWFRPYTQDGAHLYAVFFNYYIHLFDIARDAGIQGIYLRAIAMHQFTVFID